MEVSRSCYIVYYRGKKTLRELKKIKEIDIYYDSKRLRFLTVYLDTSDKDKILQQLNRVRGVIKVEESLLDQLDGSLQL